MPVQEGEAEGEESGEAAFSQPLSLFACRLYLFACCEICVGAGSQGV